jgi:hypothetical protein
MSPGLTSGLGHIAIDNPMCIYIRYESPYSFTGLNLISAFRSGHMFKIVATEGEKTNSRSQSTGASSSDISYPGCGVRNEHEGCMW